jgi:hypothetical protein
MFMRLPGLGILTFHSARNKKSLYNFCNSFFVYKLASAMIIIMYVNIHASLLYIYLLVLSYSSTIIDLASVDHHPLP